MEEGGHIWARLPMVVGAGGVLEIRNWWLARVRRG